MVMLNDERALGRISFHDGMSDFQLEYLSGKLEGWENGKSLWYSWDSENSSFGRTFRKWTRFPDYLPLCVGSEHGVPWRAWVSPHIKNHHCRVYLTWNYKQHCKINEYGGVRSIYVQHPWVQYRKKEYPIAKKNKGIGTIAFIPHLNNNTELNFDFDSYVNMLRNLPEKHQPVVLCVMCHDINRGAHKELRKYGLPLVTAGSTNSQYFVDRFYSLIRSFNYATSPNVGSHVFYALEAGVPYFLTNEEVSWTVVAASVNRKKGEIISEKLEQSEEDRMSLAEIRRLLANVTDVVTPEQRKMAEYYLGVPSELSREELKREFYKELWACKREITSLYAKKIIKKLSSKF